ncbi:MULTISPECIES: class I SAM-dependent methyltransferase [unclassified Leisingera]|uniref:class I SAM-dependent methyltransferase n=1 Tax=unclassified Leisingera TaxID=2614906 RepID=UPI0003053EAD|nr:MULTISPECIES: class I SAM-dependent methyltransferase [unclassified Leisingera]KIC23058.1 methyltransferase type 11 [Leisingera sp. ANG-S3]KIC30458.1 methyltransferase type 11 [Leisingera sp. ANG-S5]KIC52361.1 methyltransferase type 11 [Leisingera sp. ANG-S]KID09546.1 methyltransferase type 11 [Leisingera sp. ANG1]
MTDWTSGYVAGIDYTFDFHRQLTPALLGFTATAQGHRHGLDGAGLTYCELGCGQGFSANLLAAANPHIEFHAMDFSPSHIAGAVELAQEAALDNMFFHERSFEDFGDTSGLPASFDIIALHGVYSWVSEENRQHILRFIADRLKPGGLVYVSSNTQPGWAAAMPLRRILASRAEQGRGTLQDRIREAMAFGRQLAGAGGGYFERNPAVAARLEHMASMPENYVAHEYFNKDWTPFFFEDLAAELGTAKLSFAGSVSLMDNLDCVRFTPEQRALLDSESDPVRREGLRDVLLNEHFRTDVFVKGRLAHTPRGEIGAWFATTLALTRPYNGGALKFHHRSQDVPLAQAEYAPVLQALSQGPATVRSLLDQGAFGTMEWGAITRMLTVLAGTGQIAPALPQVGLEHRTAACRAFNLAVCKRAEESDALRYLASPVTGGGVELDRFEQLFLLARSEGLETPADWAALAWRILAPQGQRLQHDGRVLETEEENLALLRARAGNFAARRLPLCESLGVTLEDSRQAPAQAQNAAA